MDDPVSALDKTVMKKIMNNLILKELAGKTRILVTHSVDYLELFDKIILLRKGKVIEVGPYSKIKDNEFLKKLGEIQ